MIKYIFLIFFSCGISFPIKAGVKWGEIRYGSKQAPVKIVEYASPSCTICAEFSTTIFPKLLTYIQEKKVELIIVNLPYNALDLKACVLIKHSPNSQTFNTLVYQHQKEWLFSKDPLQRLVHFLERKGMPHDQIKKALRSRKMEDKILQRRLIEEKKQNIPAIPMLVIGHKQIIGLMPWSKLKLVIEEALMHINKGKSLETFGKNDENKKSPRKTPAVKKRPALKK